MNRRWLPAVTLAIALFIAVMVFWALITMTKAMFLQMERQVVGPLVVECLAIGVVVMASIQAVRQVIPVRGAFHRHRVQMWLTPTPAFTSSLEHELKAVPNPIDEVMKGSIGTETWEEQSKLRELLDSMVDFEKTWDLLIRRVGLATTKDLESQSIWREDSNISFFDLPLEQLCGQISMAAERALLETRTNEKLLLLLAGQAGIRDVIDLLAKDRLNVVPPGPPARDASGPAKNADDTEPMSDQTGPRALRLEALAQARSKAEERIRRNIDWLQIQTAHAWKRRVRGLAIGLAAVLGLVSALTSKNYWSIPPNVVVAGIIGGFFATVFRDMVAIIDRHRH